MKDRIIVRTTSFVSYVGEIVNSSVFREGGIVIRPNKELSMQVFVPKQEILEIVSEGIIYTYQDFIKERG